MRLTLERLFADPALTGRVPSHVRFSPDGRLVSYLTTAADDRERVDLYCYDVEFDRTRLLVDARTLASPSGEMTEAEQAERERKRFFATGISDYQWHPAGHELLLVSAGRAYVKRLDGEDCRLVTPPQSRQTDIRYSFTGAYVSYVREGDLFVCELATGMEQRLSLDGSDTVTTGIADFIAQEEMHRFDGHWWSHDDSYLLATRVDSSAIPITHRYEIAADGFTVHAQRYPFAGAANAEVALLAIERATGKRREIEWRDREDDYLARVVFGESGFALLVQNRAQSRAVLKRYRTPDAPAEIVAVDQLPTWLNLSSDPSFVPGSDELVWISERDGVARVYIADGRGGIRPLSPARGRVNKLVHVGGHHVYFAGWLDTPVEQHLFRVSVNAGEPERLTVGDGWHEPVVDREGKRFAAQVASLEAPPRLELSEVGGDRRVIAVNTLDASHPYFPYLDAHSTPTLGSLQGADGQTLWYRLALPNDFDGTRRYPVVVDVYGGPGVQRVRNDWAPLSWQLFTQAGFAVFQLDNRGGGNRDKRFEDPIAGILGNVEVQDQLVGVEFLRGQSWVDPTRIGVMGHSYGGYMVLKCLSRAPGTFAAGVAGAPVTDWSRYDTHYTERYLGTPQDNPDGYRASSVFADLDRLRDPLLVIHGMADDNVLFTHSTLLFKALQDRGVPFEIMTYPGAKHALHERSVATHRLMTILDFFKRHLIR
jgi:dipeptidyl-peptidase-4